jgi:hypothetical protein
MKKLDLQVFTLFFVSLLLLSSCSKGEEQDTQEGSTFGIVRFDIDSNKLLLDVNNEDSFYSYLFSMKKDGDCFWVSYKIDKTREENSNEKRAANGYYTVNITEDPKDVDMWRMSSSSTDISKPLLNEVEINDPMWDGNYAYIKGKLCMFNVIEIPSDQNMNWELSYDQDNLSTDEYTQSFYNVYLRATIRTEGIRSKSMVTLPNAFDVNDYMRMVANRVKDSGKSVFNLRVHYPSAISESGQITWDSKNSRDFLVSDILYDVK